MSELFDGIEQRRSDIDRHAENSARLAFAYAKFETTGQGTIEFPKRAPFDLTFIEEPFFSYGHEINLDDWAELLGMDVDDPTVPPLPVISAFVTEWDRDNNDMWVGAWLAVSVYFPNISTIIVPLDAQPYIQHHFTFQGIAMKDVNPGLGN